MGRPGAGRPFVRPRHRLEDNIKVVVQEVGWGGVDWIVIVQDRDGWRSVMIAVVNLRVP